MRENSNAQVAREWLLRSRGVLRGIADQADVSKGYVTMILYRDRAGQLREGSKRKTVEKLLRKAGAPIS